MTYINALKKIASFPRTAGAPTLERMRLLCRYLGDPQKKLKFVHIAGTNGKGSCASMLDFVLREAGYVCGRFVSPYILDFRERITVDGRMIEHEELCSITAKVSMAVSEMQRDIKRAREGEAVPFSVPRQLLDGSISDMTVQFEIVTAIGFLYFLEKRCDAVILECGLGGRYDATNIIDPPMAAVIMSIGLDHTELLGETEVKIAAEKCGIIKRGTSEVVSYPQLPEVRQVISDACVAANARITVPVRSELRLIHSSLGGLEFEYYGKHYKTRLAASYQMLNAATVIDAAAALSRVGMDLPYEVVARGLERAWFPARFEVLGVSPTVIIDGAHNASGIEAFTESLDVVAHSIKGEVTFVLGMLKDKDPKSALAPFAELIKRGNIRVRKIVTLTPDSPRAMEASELSDILLDITEGRVPIEALTTLGNRKAKELCALFSDIREEDAVVSFGSLYLASEMRDILRAFLESYEV